MPKKPSPGYVYVASVACNPNICKIGYTRGCPERRVSALKKDYPGYSFSLYRSFKFDRPARNELMAHELLHGALIDREMFSVTPIEGCIAVERTRNKHFSQITELESDFDLSENSPWEISGSNRFKCFYNYVRYNLGLEFVPHVSFDQFKNIVNTYLEMHDIRMHYDMDHDLFIQICEEAGL